MPRGLKEIRYKNMYYHELEEWMKEPEDKVCGNCKYYDVDGFCNMYNVYCEEHEDAEECESFEPA